MSLPCLARNPSGPSTTIVLYSVPGRPVSRSLTPITAWIPRARHTADGLHAKRWFDAVGHYSREDVLAAGGPAAAPVAAVAPVVNEAAA